MTQWWQVGEDVAREDFYVAERAIPNPQMDSLNQNKVSEAWVDKALGTRLTMIDGMVGPIYPYLKLGVESTDVIVAAGKILINAADTSEVRTYDFDLMPSGSTEPKFYAPRCLMFKAGAGDVRTLLVKGVDYWGRGIQETVTLNGTTFVYTKYAYAGGIRVETTLGAAADAQIKAAPLSVEITGAAGTSLTCVFSNRIGLPYPAIHQSALIKAMIYASYSDGYSYLPFYVTGDVKLTVQEFYGESITDNKGIRISVHSSCTAEDLLKTAAYWWELVDFATHSYPPNGVRTYHLRYIPSQSDEKETRREVLK